MRIRNALLPALVAALITAASPGGLRAAEEAPAAASPAALDEGEVFFNQGDYAEAVAALAEVEGGPGDPHWLAARSLTGRAFDALGMGQLALEAYADVLSAGPGAEGFEQAFNASAALSRFMEDDDTFAAAVAGLTSEQLPALERSYGLYVAGNHLFEQERYDQSVAFLSAIKRGEPLFPRARLQLAKALIMVEQRPLALAVLEELADDGGAADIPDGASLVHLNVARMAYGMGLYDQAADEYARVARGSPWWADALMERAWAQYALWMTQDSDRALSSSLGALLTLTSPSLEGLYYPEAWLLEAQILFQLCKAESGMKLIVRFMDRFKALSEGLTAGMAAAEADPQGLYGAIVAHRRGEAAASPIPGPFLSLFLADPSFDRIEAHLAKVEREVELVRRQRRAWGGGLDASFEARLKAHADAVRRQRGEAAVARLQREARILQETLIATELAQLDMLTQQIGLYEAAAAGRVSQPQKRRRWTLPDDRRVWPFEGEYWLDELGYYAVDTQSECLTIQE